MHRFFTKWFNVEPLCRPVRDTTVLLNPYLWILSLMMDILNKTAYGDVLLACNTEVGEANVQCICMCMHTVSVKICRKQTAFNYRLQ